MTSQHSNYENPLLKAVEIMHSRGEMIKLKQQDWIKFRREICNLFVGFFLHNLVDQEYDHGE